MSSRADILRAVPLFEGLADDEIRLLAERCSERRAGAGETIFKQGDEADGLYVVEEGAVTIVRDSVGEPVERLARLGPGGFFGEMGLLDRGVRSATAVASAPTRLVHVRQADLISLLRERPLLAVRLRAAVIRRHGENVASAAALSGRREVRTRIESEVEIELAGGRRLPVRLENLSPGGACLRGLPTDWAPGTRVAFTLLLPAPVQPLEVDGNVAWRRGPVAGIAFARAKDPQERAERLRRATRVLLES